MGTRRETVGRGVLRNRAHVIGSSRSIGMGAAVLLGAWALAMRGAGAAITPLSSSLSATSFADLDPQGAYTPVIDTDGTPDGLLTDLSVATFSSDGAPPGLSEAVNTTASVVYTGNNTITVQMLGSRSGTDATLGAPGGRYDSIAAYRLAFENLDVDTLTVAWALDFLRPSTGVTSPHGIGLRRGALFDSRGLFIPFSTLDGVANGMETFDLDRTGPSGLYTLELDLFMSGMTTDLAPPESWIATFIITTPAMTTIPEPTATTALLLGSTWLALRRHVGRRTASLER